MVDALYSYSIIESNILVFSPSEKDRGTQFLFGGIDQENLKSSIHWVEMSSINNT